MELTGELLTDVLQKAGLAFIDIDGKVYDCLREDVDWTPYLKDAVIDLKWRLNL